MLCVSNSSVVLNLTREDHLLRAAGSLAAAQLVSVARFRLLETQTPILAALFTFAEPVNYSRFPETNTAQHALSC